MSECIVGRLVGKVSMAEGRSKCQHVIGAYRTPLVCAAKASWLAAVEVAGQAFGMIWLCRAHKGLVEMSGHVSAVPGRVQR